MEGRPQKISPFLRHLIHDEYIKLHLASSRRSWKHRVRLELKIGDNPATFETILSPFQSWNGKNKFVNPSSRKEPFFVSIFCIVCKIR